MERPQLSIGKMMVAEGQKQKEFKKKLATNYDSLWTATDLPDL